MLPGHVPTSHVHSWSLVRCVPLLGDAAGSFVWLGYVPCVPELHRQAGAHPGVIEGNN